MTEEAKTANVVDLFKGAGDHPPDTPPVDEQTVGLPIYRTTTVRIGDPRKGKLIAENVDNGVGFDCPKCRASSEIWDAFLHQAIGRGERRQHDCPRCRSKVTLVRAERRLVNPASDADAMREILRARAAASAGQAMRAGPRSVPVIK